MGKKRVAIQTKEELLKEREKIEKKLGKEGKTVSSKIKEGKIYISSTYNNTIITLTGPRGETLAWSSAGQIGFKGTKKSTPFAASKVADNIAQIARKMGIATVSILVKGVGSGRDSALRSLAARGMDIVSIKDVTPIPHDGCRSPKVRRV